MLKLFKSLASTNFATRAWSGKRRILQRGELIGKFNLERKWRLGPESNRGTRLCRPVHNHSATQPKNAAIEPTSNVRHKNPGWLPGFNESGAGNETRTRDPDLGKVVLYQLSYSRLRGRRIVAMRAQLSSCCLSSSSGGFAVVALRLGQAACRYRYMDQRVSIAARYNST